MDQASNDFVVLAANGMILLNSGRSASSEEIDALRRMAIGRKVTFTINYHNSEAAACEGKAAAM